MSKVSRGNKQGRGFGRYGQARASGDEVVHVSGMANSGSGAGQGGGGVDIRVRGMDNRGRGLAYSGSGEVYSGDILEHSNSELQYNSSSWGADSNSSSPRNHGSFLGGDGRGLHGQMQQGGSSTVSGDHSSHGWATPRHADARGQQSSVSGEDEGDQQTGSASWRSGDEEVAASEAPHGFPPVECLALFWLLSALLLQTDTESKWQHDVCVLDCLRWNIEAPNVNQQRRVVRLRIRQHVLFDW